MPFPSVGAAKLSRQFIPAADDLYCGWEHRTDKSKDQVGPRLRYNDKLGFRQMRSIHRTETGAWRIEPVYDSLVLEIGVGELEYNDATEWAAGIYYGGLSYYNEKIALGNSNDICYPSAQLLALNHGLRKLSDVIKVHPIVNEVKILVNYKFLIEVFAWCSPVEIVAKPWFEEGYSDQIQGLCDAVEVEWDALRDKDVDIKLWLRPDVHDAEVWARNFLDEEFGVQ